jgi:mannosyltransferase
MLLMLVLAGLVGVSGLLIRDGPPVSDRPRPWAIALGTVVAAGALVCRLIGFDRSLWIDEFGTLWTTEASLGETWARAIGFHGQSPLYYVLIWPLVHGLGESEVLLRLPSLLAGAATAWVVFRTARTLGTVEAGLFAAALAWMAPVLMDASVSARPYALAMLLTALALHGFSRAVLTGGWRGRVLFIIGGVGLFLTHYVASVVMVGVAVAYVSFRDLRTRYAWHAFATDVALQLAAAGLASPQLAALWNRRGALGWIGPPDVLLTVSVLGPLVLPVLVAALYLPRLVDRARHAILWALAFAIGAQLGVMLAIAFLGTNLFAPRYLMVTTVPAAILGGVGLSRLRAPVASLCVVFAIALTTALTVLAWRVTGVPTTLVNEDWRGAVAALDADLRATPGAVVLYRPGFVEQDPWTPLHGALMAPLRSPGTTAPAWPIIPLTFAWGSDRRAEYFDEVVAPALGRAQVFFVLSGGTTPVTGHYVPRLLDWIDAEFPNTFTRRSLGRFAGIDLIRFDRVSR